MDQKKIFLESEANAWFERNVQAVDRRDFSDDPVVQVLRSVRPHITSDRPKLLEIGCGGGQRLMWLRAHETFDVYGLEPSAQAVAHAQGFGLNVLQGTADGLPFSDRSFDVVVFGFCLYLCDRSDLFRIASEADRVVRDNAWVIVHDFYAKTPTLRPYHHRDGLFSYKMDYRRLFDWHPYYTCYSHTLSSHAGMGYTDDSQDWVATSVLRKSIRHDT